MGNNIVHPTAKIGKDCKIGPNVSIGIECEIGDGVRITSSVLLHRVTVRPLPPKPLYPLNPKIHSSSAAMPIVW